MSETKDQVKILNKNWTHCKYEAIKSLCEERQGVFMLFFF